MVGGISNLTHRFRQDQPVADDSSDLSAVRAVLGLPENITNQRLSALLDERIRRSPRCSDASADAVQKTRFQELARLCRTIILLIYIIKTPDQQRLVNLHSYGDANAAFNTCIYILYDQASHCYKPLCLSPRDNLAQLETKLDRNNNDVLIILGEFVRDELGGESARRMIID
jgi:hypothetical protein